MSSQYAPEDELLEAVGHQKLVERPKVRPCRPCSRKGQKEGRCPHPWRVVEYRSCPDCTCWSLGVQANGRFVRHSVGFGHFEHGPAFDKGILRTTKCEGSGKVAVHE